MSTQPEDSNKALAVEMTLRGEQFGICPECGMPVTHRKSASRLLHSLQHKNTPATNLGWITSRTRWITYCHVTKRHVNDSPRWVTTNDAY